jgi:hypothetical protein
MPHSRAVGQREIPRAATQGMFRFVDNLMYESVRIYTYIPAISYLFSFSEYQSTTSYCTMNASVSI